MLIIVFNIFIPDIQFHKIIYSIYTPRQRLSDSFPQTVDYTKISMNIIEKKADQKLL